MRTTLVYAVLVAAVLAATAGRPLWWTLVGLAAGLWAALAMASQSVRGQGLAFAVMLSAVAIVMAVAALA